EFSPRAQSSILSNRANVHLMMENWEFAVSDAERSARLDPENYIAIILRSAAIGNLGYPEEAERRIKEVLPRIRSHYHLACAFAVIRDKTNMLKQLSTAINLDSGLIVEAKFDPDFDKFREDPDFIKLISRKRKGPVVTRE
ncbi:unnamed protein product, partial [marine sediment metagenome]